MIDPWGSYDKMQFYLNPYFHVCLCVSVSHNAPNLLNLSAAKLHMPGALNFPDGVILAGVWTWWYLFEVPLSKPR